MNIGEDVFVDIWNWIWKDYRLPFKKRSIDSVRLSSYGCMRKARRALEERNEMKGSRVLLYLLWTAFSKLYKRTHDGIDEQLNQGLLDRSIPVSDKLLTHPSLGLQLGLMILTLTQAGRIGWVYYLNFPLYHSRQLRSKVPNHTAIYWVVKLFSVVQHEWETSILSSF